MLFEFKNVSKNFGIHRVFKNLNFSLEKNTFSILTGRSGSGKTTLFKMLCGIEGASEGEIFFFGRPLQQHTAVHLRQIGFIFQNPRGIPEWTLFNNIALPLKIDGLTALEIEKRVHKWVDTLGLRPRINSLYRELSGGEIQKAEFARSLIRKPKLILADEPTAHLDPVQADLLLDLLWDHFQEGATVFISTHHPPSFEHPAIARFHIRDHTVKPLSDLKIEAVGRQRSSDGRIILEATN